MKRAFFLLSLLASPGLALAHPSHGTGSETFGMRHLLTNADHLLIILTPALIVGTILFVKKASRDE